MANTLAYYDTATITAVKSFIVQAPDQHQKLTFNKAATNSIHLFTAVTTLS
jgi:hypothetical protein